MNATAASVAASTPPPGVKSNFVDPPTIAPAIIGALTACLFISTVSVAARCIAQRSLFKKLIWADYWNIFGWAFQAAFTGFLAACIPYGAGRHLWDVTKSDFSQINFLLFVNFILYGCAILGPKMSILLQLVSIFVPRGRSLSTSSRVFYWASVFMMAVNLIYYIAHNIALIFQCNPIAKGWNKTLPGTCLDQDALLLSSGPFNIISDFLMFLLPLSVIWQLKLPVKTRLEILSAFTIGLFGCLCSAVRVYYTQQLSRSHDTTVLTFQNQLWANAEVTAATLIASIIILPRFVRSKREPRGSYQYPNTGSHGSYGTSNLKSSDSHRQYNYSAGKHSQTRTDGESPYSPRLPATSDIESGYDSRKDRSAAIARRAEGDAYMDDIRAPSPVVAHNRRAEHVRDRPTTNRTQWYSDDDDD